MQASPTSGMKGTMPGSDELDDDDKGGSYVCQTVCLRGDHLCRRVPSISGKIRDKSEQGSDSQGHQHPQLGQSGQR